MEVSPSPRDLQGSRNTLAEQSQDGQDPPTAQGNQGDGHTMPWFNLPDAH